jgi:hypothetical protein
MDKTVRGVRIVHEPYEPPGRVVESLRYSLDVFDEGDNLLGRVANLSVAHAAFEAAVAKYPDKRICIRQKARVIRSSDRAQG